MRWLAQAALLVAVLAAPAIQAQGTLFPGPHTAVCYLDVNGDGLRSLEDPVYLQQSCAGGTSAGDARLFSSGGFPGGTLIEGLHEDAGTATAGIAATYAFHDADSSGAYGFGDPLYLALGPVPGTLRPGDVPLSGGDAFTSLDGDDHRVGFPILAAPVAVGAESYQERDGNPGFTTQDSLYLDLDGSGRITIGDLRLAVPATQGDSTTSATSDMTATATTSSQEKTPAGPSSGMSSMTTTDAQQASVSTSSAPGDGAGVQTPGPGAFLVVALLLGALRLRSLGI
jgi:hypothetical protein